jgi:tRNA U34 5-methylaminomethyl-2-thiouridine-forming methyltransferase MnmC
MQLVTTGDGSHTLYLPQMDEHYHSRFGAIAESRHVFLEAGFNASGKRESISVLEVGFGTGLNALLTCMAARERKIFVYYRCIDKFPLPYELAVRLNYKDFFLPDDQPDEIFRLLHETPWNTECKLYQYFTLYKCHADIVDFKPWFSYELIYFDAFAPDKQPECWSPQIFRRLYENLLPGGILTTYCVKGQVKRTLKEVGFHVERLPGPPGKREMLRGRKMYAQ